MMRREDMITMTTRELKRLHLIHKAIEKEITQNEAAKACRLSERQVRRIISKVKTTGDKAIIHQARGKPSNAKLPEKKKQRIIALYKSRYPDFGPTLAQEKLLDNHKIRISDETLRLWLHKQGPVRYRTRKKKPNRIRRERKECFGQMIQMDGSDHDWLEGRCPWLVLMGYIDDATGNVYAEFHDYEGTLPAMTSFYHYILKYGLPGSVYLDKHSTYKVNQEPSIEDQLKGEEFKSQFQRALESLGVEVIHAHSPQAKGRVERLFETFQDRLVKELRLEDAKDKKDANKVLRKYLPKFNQKFRRVPKKQTNLHQKIPSGVNLKRILSRQHDCSLANDNTIRCEGKIYLIKERLIKSPNKKIRLEERINGKTYLLDGNRNLQYKQVNEPPRAFQERSKRIKKTKKITIPQKNHPWREPIVKQSKSLRLTKNRFYQPEISPINTPTQTFGSPDMSSAPREIDYPHIRLIQKEREENRQRNAYY